MFFESLIYKRKLINMNIKKFDQFSNVTLPNLPTNISGRKPGDNVIIVTEHYKLPAIFQGKETYHLEESSPMDDIYLLIPGYIPVILEQKEVMFLSLPINVIFGGVSTVKAYSSNAGKKVASYNVNIIDIVNSPMLESKVETMGQFNSTKCVKRFEDTLFEQDYILEAMDYSLEGKKVKLMSDLEDPSTKAPKAGDEGTIKFVDNMGNIHVRWDNGGVLSLIPEEDDFQILE